MQAPYGTVPWWLRERLNGKDPGNDRSHAPKSRVENIFQEWIFLSRIEPNNTPVPDTYQCLCGSSKSISPCRPCEGPRPTCSIQIISCGRKLTYQRPGKESMGQDAARSVKRVSIPVLPPVRTTSSNTIGWASFSGIRHKLPPPHCPNYFLFSLAKVDFDVSVPVSSLLPEVDVTDVLLPQLERIAHCSLHLAGSKQSTLRP